LRLILFHKYLSEIAKTENRLKLMKQQLANKLETFQSTYNVVQKTITEISKLVSIPNFPNYVKPPSSITEDDWDEGAKPKFLNKWIYFLILNNF